MRGHKFPEPPVCFGGRLCTARYVEARPMNRKAGVSAHPEQQPKEEEPKDQRIGRHWAIGCLLIWRPGVALT